MMNLNITDKLNILSKLSAQRILNALKVVSSYYISKLSKTPYQWGMPISIAIEPTTSCNLRCPECPSGKREFTRPTGMLEEGFFKKTIDEMHNRLVYLVFYFQGEPYLNPLFLEMVNYAAKKNIYTATSTNAHFLTDELSKKTVLSGLDRLIISIDGTTQKSYQAYRIGGTLDKVLEGTRNIVKWKKELKSKTPTIIFQFLVVKQNEHQIEEVKLLGKELGVDEVRFKTAQIYDFEHGSDLMPTLDKYSRYKKKDIKLNSGETMHYEIKNKLLNHCWKLWHSSVITWDGMVVPCCFDKDAKHPLGSLKEFSFKELWKAEAYNTFRSAVLRSRKEIDICKNCTEGTKVWT